MKDMEYIWSSRKLEASLQAKLNTDSSLSQSPLSLPQFIMLQTKTKPFVLLTLISNKILFLRY